MCRCFRTAWIAIATEPLNILHQKEWTFGRTFSLHTYLHFGIVAKPDGAHMCIISLNDPSTTSRPTVYIAYYRKTIDKYVDKDTYLNSNKSSQGNFAKHGSQETSQQLPH